LPFNYNLKKYYYSLSENIKHRNTDVYIVSFPKSGRTWLRVLIGKYLTDYYNILDEYILDTYYLTTKTKNLKTEFTHDGSGIRRGYRYNQLFSNKNKYINKKIILLVRNTKDVLVSCYFQANKRIYKFEGDISEFIKDEHYGAIKLVSFYKIWYEHRFIPKDFLIISYENLHESPNYVLKNVLRFLEIKDIDDELISKAVDYAQFENMKKLERNNYFKKNLMKPTDVNDFQSYKVREGKINNYHSYMSATDIDFIEKVKEVFQCPFE